MSSEAFYMRGIPHELKAKYKELCSKHHIPMTEGIARFLRIVTKKGNSLWDEILCQPPVGRELKKEE